MFQANGMRCLARLARVGSDVTKQRPSWMIHVNDKGSDEGSQSSQAEAEALGTFKGHAVSQQGDSSTPASGIPLQQAVQHMQQVRQPHQLHHMLQLQPMVHPPSMQQQAGMAQLHHLRHYKAQLPCRPHLPAIASPICSTVAGVPHHLGTGSRGFFQGRLQQFTAGLFDPDRQVTNLLIAANLLAYVLEIVNPGIVHSYAQINALLDARGQYYRIVTAAFLHGGPLHLLGNMLSLHWLGAPVEQLVGRQCFLLLYFSSAVSAGLMHYLMGPPMSAVVGASGAVAGLMAAIVVCKVRNRIFVPFTVGDATWIGQVVLLNMFVGAVYSNVSHWGHLGGLLGGAAAMYLFGPRYMWGERSIVNQPLIPLFRDMPGVK